MMIRSAFPILALLAAGCSNGDDTGPVRADMIGEATAFNNPVAALPSPSDALLLQATAHGLVRVDGEGQIEPALAKRWIVLDDGETYVFRLNDVTWDDGTAVTAGQIARQLRNVSRPGRGNRLAPLLADIESVQAVTPLVIEINLSQPRQDFLHLLATPDLAIFTEGAGLGPFRIADGYSADGESVLLAPRREPPEEIDGEPVAPIPIAPSETVELRFQSPAMAVARFQRELTDIVLGGRWTTLIYADAIDANSNQLQIDPVEGLFGLAIVETEGFLADPQNREILSLAIDRAQLVDFMGGDRAEARLAIIPLGLRGLPDSVAPPWAETTIALRRGFAQQAIGNWQRANGEITPLRVALPDDAGSQILFSVLRTNWAAIGVPVRRVSWTDDADLRLIDRVAPTESVRWFFEQFRCGNGLPCSDAYDNSLTAFEEATSDRVREIRATEAANELMRLTPFIPLLRPIRWSLISPRITGFTPNLFASHPLDTLTPPS